MPIGVYWALTQTTQEENHEKISIIACCFMFRRQPAER